MKESKRGGTEEARDGERKRGNFPGSNTTQDSEYMKPLAKAEKNLVKALHSTHRVLFPNLCRADSCKLHFLLFIDYIQYTNVSLFRYNFSNRANIFREIDGVKLEIPGLKMANGRVSAEFSLLC